MLPKSINDHQCYDCPQNQHHLIEIHQLRSVDSNRAPRDDLNRCRSAFVQCQCRIHILLARYLQGGLDVLKGKSTAPKTHAISDEVRREIILLRKELVRQGLDKGAETIAWHLKEADLPVPAASTTWRILDQDGSITPQPKKHPRPTSNALRLINPLKPGNQISLIGIRRWKR